MVRFLLGFAAGAAVGAAIVIVSAPRSGAVLRQGISNLFADAFEAGRQAAIAREQELWDEFHKRLKAE